MTGYGSLKEALQRRLEGGNREIDASRVTKTSAESLAEIDDFEKFFSKALRRIKERAAIDAAAAANEIRNLKQAIEALHARIQIRDIDLQRTEETLRSREAAYIQLQQSLAATNRALQDELAQLKRTLRQRDTQLAEIKKQLELDRKELEAEAPAPNVSELAEPVVQTTHATADSQAASNATDKRSIDPGEPSSPPAFKNGAKTTPSVVPQTFFTTATKELSEVLGPLAGMIIRYDVERLGESMQNFPTARITELIDILSKDIPDDDERARFRERLFGEISSGA